MSAGHKQKAYLGDGVYAAFDGFQIWLAVNHEENYVVALEPDVMARLAQYAGMVYKPLTDEEKNQIDASNQHQERDE